MTQKGHLGLIEVISMGLGALIGGGIFSVLGVAANIAGKGIILSYTISGIIALCSGYSYGKLTGYLKKDGGSFIFLEHRYPEKKYGGMLSWFLVLGYVGSMAMYAYAFGAFMVIFLGNTSIASIPGIRAFFSVGILLVFLLINLRSISNSASAENIMVYSKVIILLAFGVLGVYAIFFGSPQSVQTGGIFETGLSSPILAISVIFVSFQGFQLLVYDYTEIRGGSRVLEKGIFISILSASIIYILIAWVTTSLLSPAEIMAYEETVLAYAAAEIFSSDILRTISFYFIALAAIFSTASAINATLFGTSRLVSTISSKNYLPKNLAAMNKEGIPFPALVFITLLTAVFTFVGSLEEITSYASLSFLVIFAVVNFLALREKQLDARKWISVIGLFGTIASLILFGIYMLQFQLSMLYYIGGITLIVLVLEFLFFQKEVIFQRLSSVMDKQPVRIDLLPMDEIGAD